MNLKELEAWVEANPGKSILIGGGLLILLLWLFGFFSSSAPAQDNSGQSLAAAYYAAEAQQAVVGGQVQQATIASQAATAQTLITSQTAQAINATNAQAATTINQSNNNTLSDVASKQLTLGENNNATLLAGLQSNNATLLAQNDAAIQGAETITALNTIIPQELAISGGFGNFQLPGLGGKGFNQLSVNTGGGASNPASLEAVGYDPNTARAISLQELGLSSFPNNPSVSG